MDTSQLEDSTDRICAAATRRAEGIKERDRGLSDPPGGGGPEGLTMHSSVMEGFELKSY